MFTSKKSALKWILMALSLLPAGLFAYQGTFSRIIADDFMGLFVGKQLGPLESMLYWWSTHNGSYTVNYLHGLLAPIDTIVPSVMPLIIIALMLLGMTWLNCHLLTSLHIARNRLALATALAALVVAAALNALYTPHAIFWYSANIRYVLPLTIFMIYLAFVIANPPRASRGLASRLAWLSAAAICFLSAGLSEMYMLFQVTLMTLICIYMAWRRIISAPAPFAGLLAAGWLGSLASLAIQVMAPGTAIRMERNSENLIWFPVRALPELISGTIDRTFQLVGHQEAFAGFMLLFAAGLFLTIRVYKPFTDEATAREPHLSAAPLWLGLIAQICFLPIFWTHISDNPQFFSRFSAPFTIVVGTNLLMIIAFASSIWGRGRLASLLSRHAGGWRIYVSIMLVIVTLLFGMTQLRSIHFKAATYLFTTALLILLILCWHFSAVVANRLSQKLILFAILWQLATVICSATLVAALLYTQGGIQPRVLSAIAFMQVVAGLFWGISLGMRIKQFSEGRVAFQTWLARLSWLSLALALVIGAGIVIGQARSVPKLAAFADEWDGRDALMREWAESDRRDVVVPRLSVDIAEFFCCSNESSAENANYYYGFKPLALNWRGD